MIPQRYDIEVEEGTTPRMVVYKDGRFILYADAREWVQEKIALLKNEHDEALRKSALDQKQCDEMTSEAARMAEEIATKDGEIRKLSLRIQKDSRPCPPCEHLDEKIKEIAELRAELESHTWKVSPAMAQAKIDALNEEIAALKEELKEAYSKNEKLLLFANRIAKEGQHDLGSNKLCDCVLCRIIQGAAKECI